MTHVEPSPQRVPPRPAGSFPNAWTLFDVQGIPVRLDRSWLLIAALIAFQFFQALRVVLPESGPVVVVALAVLGSVLFFVSILAHELGHALTSLDRNIPVLSITLFALGGVTESTQEAKRARDEFVIVGIGPFISLVMAALFGLLYTFTSSIATVAAIAGYLAWTNLALAIFNIVPAYPLDGGRLLRSILWAASGKADKATRWAARVGQAFAAAFIAWAVLGFITGSAGGFGGLWEVLIGLFLFRGATDSHRRATLRERFEQTSVRTVMGSVPPALPGAWSLAQALEAVQQRPSLLWPVDDPVTGGLLISQIDDVPSDRWPTTTVAEIAMPAVIATVPVATPLTDAVERMIDAPEQMLIVVEDGHPIGLLTPSLVSNASP